MEINTEFVNVLKPALERGDLAFQSDVTLLGQQSLELGPEETLKPHHNPPILLLSQVPEQQGRYPVNVILPCLAEIPGQGLLLQACPPDHAG
jgi:hypothetical protein